METRVMPDAFEQGPGTEPEVAAKPTETPGEARVDTVSVGGQEYVVQVADGGDVTNIQPTGIAPAAASAPAAAPASSGEPVPAPLAGNIFKILVSPGQQVEEGETIFILEAMKMETEIRSTHSGVVSSILVSEGEAVTSGQPMLELN